MPTVLETESPLIKLYQDAWERVVSQQQALIDDPLRAARRARLAEMRASIESIMEEVEASSRAWIERRLPALYATGGTVGAEATGASSFLWNSISQEAVEELAFNLMDEVLAATKHVDATTKGLIREIARAEGLQKLIEGRTATQAGKEMSKLIAKKGISAIVYSNGARHGLADYGEMLARTTTAKAYNIGVLNGAAQNGCQFWEVFDGPDCGWSTHDSGELALGKIVTREEALSYPISHPRCRRSFGPRPDLNGTSPSGNGQVTPEQVAAQRAQDQERAARQARGALRRQQQQSARAGRGPKNRLEKRAQKLEKRTTKPDPNTPVGVRQLAKPQSAVSKPIPADLKVRVDRTNRRTINISGKKVPLGKLSPDARRQYLSNKEKLDLDRYQELRRQPRRQIPKKAVLDASEKQDIYNYAWDYETYLKLNNSLRSGGIGGISGDLERYTRLLNKYELDVDATTHRVMFFDSPSDMDKFRNLKVGDTLTEPGFMSTSLDRAKAEDFLGDHNVQLEIVAPKGTKAIHIGDSLGDKAYDQAEVLFQRGTTMEVLSVVRDGDTIYLKVRAIQQPVWSWEAP